MLKILRMNRNKYIIYVPEVPVNCVLVHAKHHGENELKKVIYKEKSLFTLLNDLIHLLPTNIV